MSIVVQQFDEISFSAKFLFLFYSYIKFFCKISLFYFIVLDDKCIKLKIELNIENVLTWKTSE